MKKTSDEDLAEKYHIAKFKEVDDFFWLWEKFLEDDIWEEAGHPRIFSAYKDGNYNVIPQMERLYDFMFAKFNKVIKEEFLSKNDFYKYATVFIEFSRGGERGYDNALSRLSKEVLEKSSIFYVDVTFEESWRRNVARYEEKLKHSSLAHMAPRETMERYYKIDDWKKITCGKESGFLEYNGVKIPFVTMNNFPELNERDALSKRYQPHLDRLMELSKEVRGV
jgi:hypothetical protein